MKFSPEIKPLNTLKNEHLSREFKPIIGGIYDRNNLDQKTQYFLDAFKRNAEHIHFGSEVSELQKNNMLNAGKDTYIISPCDSLDKYSEGYLNCTGVIISGFDKETHKNISIMSHQNPEWFLNKDNDNIEIRKFKSDLIKRINELKDRCILGSIDAIIFGGNKEDVSGNVPDEKFKRGYDDEEEFIKDSYDSYIKSIKTAKVVVTETLGFSPIVMAGPNDNFSTALHSLTSYYDNENRRIYMIKPKQNESKKNEPFLASEVEDHIERFKNKNEK